MSEPSRAGSTGRTRGGVALSRVLPGLPQLLAGRWGVGLVVLGVWVGFWWVLLGRWGVVVGALRNGALDDRLAVLTLGVGMVAAWLWSLRDVKRGDSRAELGVGQWQLAMRVFAKNRTAVAGLVVVTGMYVVALITPLISPADPTEIGPLAERLQGMSSEHLLGTDQVARDVFSRLLYGARVSLSIGFIAVGISVTIGTLLGAIAGYVGGLVDGAIMRFVDMVLSFPRLILLIVIVAAFQPSIFLIIAVLGLTLWPGTARLVRGEVLSLREREFIHAAEALGYSRRRIIFKHLIPNALGPVIVAATLGIGHTIVLEAGLSFLGLGIQGPTPSWGSMVADGRRDLLDAWWLATFPGLAIVFTVLSFNLVGDGLRDALDPRLRS